jgi:tRNA nucleotidyltransferase (CCA-adding enzyme)
MVRAARFAGQFGFQLEPKTEQAMKSLKHECIYLSVERITAEIEKMWGSERASIGLDYLFRTEVIKYIPPFRYWNLQLVPHPNTLKLVDQCKDRIVRWAYLLYICGTGEDQIKSRLIELRLSNADISKITTCFHLGTLWPAPLSKIEAKKLLLKHGLEAVIRAAHLAKLLLKIPFPEQVESFIEGCWAEMPVKSLKELKISGKDLVMQKEWTPGPWVKQTLNYLLEQVALGLIPNEKEILLKKGCQFGTDHS